MSRKDSRLHQLGVICKYLQDTGYLTSLSQQCATSQNKKHNGIHTVLLPVDLMQLAEMDSDVADVVTCRPLDGTMLFREVIHQVFVCQGLIEDDQNVTQLVVSLRITSATLPQLSLTGGQKRLYNGYFRLRCIVLGVTASVTYTKSARYICPNKECDGHHSNHYIRIHIPGASERETVGQRFKCSVCFMVLKEDRSQRTLSDKLLAEVVPVHVSGGGCDQTQTGSRHQAVRAIIRDDLCCQVQLGHQYEMIGTQRMDTEGDTITCMFEVNNLISVNSELVYGGQSLEATFAILPRAVQQLYSDWGKAPFVFPQLMAFLLADKVIPSNCMFKLKLLLLISLVLRSDVSQLHILAVCLENHLVQRLMELCSSLAFTTTKHSSLSTLGAKASASWYPWAPYFVQGGSLVLASGGVCRVGDVRDLKRGDRAELQAVLSESRVLVTLEAKHTGSLPHVQTLPLLCQVWAHAALDIGSRGQAKTMCIPPALFDAFSIVCHCDVTDAASTDVSEDLVTFMLTSNMSDTVERCLPGDRRSSQAFSTRGVGGQEDFFLSVEDFKKYVTVAREQKSVMTVEAEWLLTAYLIAARRVRSNSLLGTAVPVSAMQTLQALAHGLCKLSLRKEVLETDALMAVYLYEESLSARYGMSGLSVFPEPNLPAASAETYITSQMPITMRKFHTRLLSFCTGSSASVSMEE